MTRDRLRVAAVQFATGGDLDENLATCLRMLDQAVDAGAELVVFPEFANHISVYESAEHSRAVAVDLEGAWIGALAERVRSHGVHVVVTVTVPRKNDRITVTNVLIGPDGTIVATADKNTLMGNERAYLSGAGGANDVAETDFGVIGLYSCMDGVTFETPRGLAVRGARLLTNSLNSFAIDEASLHIPVRAVENGVFIVAANKVGALLPPDLVDNFSNALGVPANALNGAGESQIVAPDGTVIAKGPRTGEAVVVADLDLSQADTAPLAHRRPEIYKPLASPETKNPRADVPDTVAVACAPGAGDPSVAVDAVNRRASLVVLPDLTDVPDVIPPGVHVVTTAQVDGGREGHLWTNEGLVHRQRQLHHTSGTSGPGALDDHLAVVTTPFGDLAVIVGQDHAYPEVFRLAAIQGAHIVAVVWQPTRAVDTDLLLVERAAENRLCLAACAGPGQLGGTMVLNPPLDSLWSPDRERPYDGTINTPEIVRAAPTDQLLEASVYPPRSLSREISRDTDLVGGRSWEASSVLVG
ncbi:MAG: nitrilase-related carbon-nitrogen hydrolase [Acidimicrobiales bacterium]